MDTRFWGPSGWALLHLIAADPTVKSRQKETQQFFTLLPFVLPCKYCRASLSDYYAIQPLTAETLKDEVAFSRWLYDIHNRVNGKLRGQGLLTSPNPSWASVHAKYKKQQAGLCDSSPLLGWDFMTSVAFTTPALNYKAVPMPDTPEMDLAALDLAARNRYNLLTRAERISALKEWWSLIPAILPCPAWRASWSAATVVQECGPIPLQKGREVAMQWMWAVEEQVCQGLRCPPPHESLPFLKKTMRVYESSCGLSKSKKAKTCRRNKKKAKASRKRARPQ
jgi:hypothetical protein